ncbi:hypothetical protein AB1A65_09830 [Muricauda sp. ANG21]|uniref:hypothetical protein n=1 Tax=Allomuricauda sp. ANG21 TaxID=3042468 RepID=UPI003452CBD2
MKLIDGLLFVLVVIMWLTVTMHIMDFNGLDTSIKDQLIRTDLVLVPICISVTVYIFWNIFKQNRK